MRTHKCICTSSASMVWAQAYTPVSITPVTVYLLVCTDVKNSCAIFHPPHNMYTYTHKARLNQRRSSNCATHRRDRTPSVTVRKNRRVNAEQPNPHSTHHAVATARCADHIHSYALVQSQCNWSMAQSGCWPRGQYPKLGFFSILAGFSHLCFNRGSS